jgi:aquaporin Z
MESTSRDRPDAAQQPVIQRQPAPDFFDTSFEWRRVFAETWGTFLLVLVAAGGGVVAAMSDGRVTLGMMAVAPGLMVMVIIYSMGALRGAHLNPAVTLAFAVRRDFPWQRVPGYIFGQLIGGIGAAAFLRAMFGTVGALGATLPGHGVTGGKALAMEVVLTVGLVHTILGTASGARNVGSNGALAVGGYIALAGLWAAPITGSSMNPVRSLGPDVVRGEFHTTWIYLVAPVIGALIAVAFEWILKGKPTAAGRLTAQGTLRVGDRGPGRILECNEAATPCGSPVTVSKSMLFLEVDQVAHTQLSVRVSFCPCSHDRYLYRSGTGRIVR